MKYIFVAVLSVLFPLSKTYAQVSAFSLFALFPEMPQQMNNEELITVKNESDRIAFKYYSLLGVSKDDHDVFPIGKIIVGNTIHLFYADVKYAINGKSNDFLMDISALAFNKETGQPSATGPSFYLGIIGKDMYTRSSSFKLNNNNTITFTVHSLDNETGKKRSEMSTYKIGVKDLELLFSSL